jgi:hypothetical protein
LELSFDIFSRSIVGLKKVFGMNSRVNNNFGGRSIVPERLFLESLGENNLKPLPLHVHESYRLIYRCGWGGNCSIRAESQHNEDLDSLGIPLTEGVPSQDGMSVTFRQKQGGSFTLERWRYRLICKGLGSGNKVDAKERNISRVQWATFAVLLNTAHFWELPAQCDKSGFDGADWTLEGATQGRYRWVHRWSPNPEDSGEWFVLPCQYLLDLAGR